PLDGARRDDGGRALEGQPDERDLRPADPADLVGREDRLVRAREEDVRGEEREQRASVRSAVLAAVDGVAPVTAELVPVAHALQLVDALVELVVADTSHVHAD